MAYPALPDTDSLNVMIDNAMIDRRHNMGLVLHYKSLIEF
jgi:hypothetical protein